MKINPAQVWKEEAERKARPVPVPVIRFKKSESPEVGKSEKPEVIITYDDAQWAESSEKLSDDIKLFRKDQLLDELWKQMTVVKKDRAKESTRSSRLVEELEDKLRKTEGPATAEEFMKGNIGMPELEEQYRVINSYTEQAMKLYDKIQHVERYGELPGETTVQGPQTSGETDDAKVLKYEIRRLDDLIYKTNNKLKKANGGIKAPKNSDRVNEWKKTVALADARRHDLKLKLKNVGYGR